MLTELRPKKELLDPAFNGYKLSLEAIPVYRHTLSEGVDHVTQNEDQYSFIHTKVFSLHNHLFNDSWHDNTVFFVNNAWKVLKASISPDTGRVESLEAVWTVPYQNRRRPGHFNVSLAFPNPGIALVADGCGNLHLLNRNEDSLWLPEVSSPVGEADTGSLLTSAVSSDDNTVSCVLMSLETKTAPAESIAESNKPKPALVNTTLHWITYKKDVSGGWTVSGTRQLKGTGTVDYVALEPSNSALYVCSNSKFKFTTDSANPISEADDESEPVKRKPLYLWRQTEDDINVTVEVGPGVERDTVEVEVRERQLTVRCQQQTLVSGDLHHAVDTNLTTWVLQPGSLEITLSKRDTGLMWPELIIGDEGGEQAINPEVVEDVHNRLSHLCSDDQVQERGEEYAPTFNLDQLEECDIAPDDTRCLYRLDAATHTVSHQISLAGHQWLMSVSQPPAAAAAVPSVCVRHDVDGCVWQLHPPPPFSPTDWPCEHIGTFLAFGYVAASKQQKKFVIAAPDLSYAVICEASNHVFIYRKASAVDGELRNRKSSTKVPTIAKQQLINLETPSPILGAQAFPSYLFVLTADTLYTFHV